MSRYAIIDNDGIVYEGEYEYVIEAWNNDADTLYNGRVLFVQIQDEK